MTSEAIVALYSRALDLDHGRIAFEDVSFIGLCNLYLFASFAYDRLNHNFISDVLFDKLCKYLYDNWDFLGASGVWHVGNLIIEDNLKTGSCLGIEYPDAVKEISAAIVNLSIAVAPAEEEYDI